MEQPIETTLYSLANAPPSPGERRRSGRHLTLYRVGLLDLANRRELCLIKNISAGGMMIRAYCALRPGEPVTVELKCGQPVHGRISWIEGGSAGIRFDRPVDVIDILSSTSTDKRPRMPRVATDGVATIRQEDSAFQVRLVDISQGGVRVIGREPLKPGRETLVSILGLPPQRATLCWRDGATAGFTFHGLLPLTVLIDWLQVQREALRQAG